MLYFFKYTLVDGVYKVAVNRSVSNDTFFSDYTSYGDKEVLFEVEVVNGELTATAKVKEHPENVLTITASDVASEGSYGFFIEGGGAINYPKVKLDVADALITVADTVNGDVYVTGNSGAAKVGDTVKLVPVIDEYPLEAVYTSVAGGEKQEVALGASGYTFTKQFGATEVSAVFKSFKFGDIDNDGDRDGSDLVAMRKFVVGAENNYEACYIDCNKDGETDVRDLVNLKKLTAGIK